MIAGIGVVLLGLSFAAAAVAEAPGSTDPTYVTTTDDLADMVMGVIEQGQPTPSTSVVPAPPHH